VLHQVGVSFDLYYGALKHKIKNFTKFKSGTPQHIQNIDTKHDYSRLSMQHATIGVS
jgi:hypothetical protein